MYCKYLQMVFIQHNYRKCPKWFHPSLLNYSKMVLMDLNGFNSSCITQKPWWVFKLHHRRRSWANNAWLSRCHRSARSGPCLQPLSTVGETSNFETLFFGWRFLANQESYPTQQESKHIWNNPPERHVQFDIMLITSKNLIPNYLWWFV